MSYSDVRSLTEQLKSEYGTADPIRLCEDMGICILYQPMGTHSTAIKGFVVGVDNVFTIMVNSDLPDNIQRVIIAHELCHALMHCSGRIKSRSDSALFGEISESEREANLFAAELLVSDEDVLNTVTGGETFFELAAKLYVPAELLDFKLLMMKSKGISIPESPLQSHNNFLKGIRIGNE